MPIGTWGKYDTPLLSGMFGSFQSLSAQYADTGSVWKTLRVNAATFAWQARGGGDLPPVEELEATGAELLRAQGVDAIKVGTYRSIAGSWRSAKANLQGAAQDQQITGAMIFQPPWAQTLDPNVPSRYRMRVQWEGEDTAGNVFNTWGAYEMTPPLTSIADAIAQAKNLIGKSPGSDTPPGAVITGVSDYEMEQI